MENEKDAELGGESPQRKPKEGESPHLQAVPQRFKTLANQYELSLHVVTHPTYRPV